MIVNAKDVEYIIIELSRREVKSLLNGREFYQSDNRLSDKSVLVHIYVSDPETCDEE
jgi:hypothetical protein